MGQNQTQHGQKATDTGKVALVDQFAALGRELLQFLRGIGYGEEDAKAFVQKFFLIGESHALEDMVSQLPPEVQDKTVAQMKLLDEIQDEDEAVTLLQEIYRTVDRHLSASTIAKTYKSAIENLYTSYMQEMAEQGVYPDAESNP